MQTIDEKSIAGDLKRGYKYMLSAAEGLRNLIEHLSETELKRASDIDLFPQVVIVCGKGNNGGDGLALAALLSKLHYEIKVFTLATSYSDEAKLAEADAIKAGIKITKLKSIEELELVLSKEKPEFVVDALLGTGSKGAPQGLTREAIIAINNYKQKNLQAKIIAVDIPSGLNADTGTIDELCVIADHTVCMGYAKLGFAFYPARSVLGELHVRNLDYPASVLRKAHTEAIYTLGIKDLIDLIPSRSITGSKFDHGTAVMIAGSKAMGGAAIICASAALESGLGMLHLLTAGSNTSAINTSVPEVVTHSLISFDEDINAFNIETCIQLIKNKEPDAICMGPAMSIEAPAQSLVRRLLEYLEDSKSKSSVILDADAINAFRNNHKGLKHKGLDILVTPHYGELARISPIEISADEISKLSPLEKIKLLRHFTKATGCNILLKGSPSILVDAKTQQAFVLPYGNSGLAKAGSGDCLSGIITAMAAQIARRGESHKLAVSSRAALVAAFLLGKTAETIAPEYGEYSISASKIIANLHKILKAF